MRYDHVRNVVTLSKKNITLYVRRGPVLIFGLMFPFFLGISWILGRSLSLSQIFVGICAMTSFFTSTSVSPVILPIETREKSLERLLNAPLSMNEILFGIIAASSAYSIIITSAIVIIFITLFPTLISSPISVLIIFVGISLMAILGSILGLLISARPTDMTSDIMVMINLVKFPLLFIGGIFIPLKDINPSITFIYFLSPLTPLTEVLRSSVDQSNLFSSQICLLILFIWIVLLLVINTLFHRKTMPKRFSETGGGSKMKMRKKK